MEVRTGPRAAGVADGADDAVGVGVGVGIADGEVAGAAAGVGVGVGEVADRAVALALAVGVAVAVPGADGATVVEAGDAAVTEGVPAGGVPPPPREGAVQPDRTRHSPATTAKPRTHDGTRSLLGDRLQPPRSSRGTVSCTSRRLAPSPSAALR